MASLSGEREVARGSVTWTDDIATGAAHCYITTLIVLLGATLGGSFVDFCTEHPSASRSDFIGSLAAWDGGWYARIATDGYTYDPRRESSVAFFPAFPLLARGLMALTGMRAEAALLAVSHLFLLASFILAARYVRLRFAVNPQGRSDLVLLAMGLFPTTFYFRMAYTESLFLFLIIVALLGMESRWRPAWIALIIGLTTATRPVGVALLLPFAIHLWPATPCNMKRDQGTPMPSFRQTVARLMVFGARSALLVPLACWGIVAYISFQWWQFDEPLAFLKTQVHWGRPAGHASVLERAWCLLTLAPIWAVYDSVSPCYWGLRPPRDNPLFNMMFANPIYLLMAVGCVVVGAWKRWLNAMEVALSAMLLLIPYVTQGDRMCMASQARFASVVFPMYIVLGQILSRLPGPVVAVLAALSAVMLALYTALFVNWYWFY